MKIPVVCECDAEVAFARRHPVIYYVGGAVGCLAFVYVLMFLLAAI